MTEEIIAETQTGEEETPELEIKEETKKKNKIIEWISNIFKP